MYYSYQTTIKSQEQGIKSIQTFLSGKMFFIRVIKGICSLEWIPVMNPTFFIRYIITSETVVYK